MPPVNPNQQSTISDIPLQFVVMVMHHPTAINQQGLGKHVLQDVIKIFF